MKLLVAGYWRVESKTDPRWNGGGRSDAVGGFVMPREAEAHIAAKKKELGSEPPADCTWSYDKD